MTGVGPEPGDHADSGDGGRVSDSASQGPGPDVAPGSNSASPVRTTTSKSARITAIVIGVIALGFIAVLATRDGGEKSIRNQFLGHDAPPIEGASATNPADTFRMADQRGKYVVVNFFATWCTPCVKEHRELVSLFDSHKDVNDLALVSVVYQDEINDVKSFFAKRGGTWPVINSARIAVDWGVRGVPETYVIDPNGIVIYQNNGGITQAAIERVLADANGGR
jgi:cytochrome c biogenesis protein CcmG, thiol:disulfide interchange protein DsbE